MAQSFVNLDFPLVAVLAKKGKVYLAEPAFVNGENIYVGRKSLAGARAGELVLLRSAGRGRGEVIKRFGKANSLPVIMEAILAHFRVPRGFSARALAEAESQAALTTNPDPGRHDLTSLTSFTIDPDEAKDFDDAISLVGGPGPDETTLYVHIADVSYFVVDGSALDQEAARKGVSVYLPIAVEPMLPPMLSSDACSLKPDEERKCVTVEMVFALKAPEKEGDREGGPSQRDDKRKKGRKKSPPATAPPPAAPELKSARFYRSLIRSRQRLTYNQVDDLFAGQAAAGHDLAPLLNRCRLLAQALREARHRRGALAIETFEPEFRLSEEREIIAVRPRPESESHALIEEFMIAANEAVADFLEQRGSDCIYRIHEEPDAEAVDSLFNLLESLGIPTPSFSFKQATPAKAGQAVRELLLSLPQVLSATQQTRSAFGEIVLRSLKQARYLEDNLGHFGLASPAYLHFTSPIRRYPDLIVHRALLRELHLEQWSCSRLQLSEVAQDSSQAERRAAQVEHAGDDVALAFLLDRLLFEEGWDRIFEGEIVSVIPSGLFVRFHSCYEGYVPARRLGSDYFAISDQGGSLVGRRFGRPFRLGDPIAVRVVRIDKLKGKIELEPARG